MAPDWHAKAIALYDRGSSTYTSIAKRFGVSRGAVGFALNRSRAALGARPRKPLRLHRDRPKRVRSDAYYANLREYMRKRRANAA